MIIKKLKVILLAILVLAPSLASAKMIKFGEGNDAIYINEVAIHIIAPVKNGCEVTYLQGGATRKWVVEMSCADFIKDSAIEISNSK